MKLTKYLSTNILSFFCNIISFAIICLFYLMMHQELSFSKSILLKSFFSFIFYLGELCINFYLFIFSSFCLALIIELFFHKLTKNKFILNISLKNKSIIYTYYILFWLGIICSILYLIGYIWFVSKLTP